MITRRRLLQLAAGAAAAYAVRPWPLEAPTAVAQTMPRDALSVATLEAFADTLIPGGKRSADDRTVAGAAPGAGAVQAGAIDLVYFPPAAIGTVAPALAAGLNLRASEHAGRNRIALDPTVPPFVALDFAQRTELSVRLLDGDDPDQAAWEALAAIIFLAYHTAGHLPTADAVRSGHPGLAAIGFPAPDPDGLWRFPDFSYGRPLARPHRAATAKGHPG